MHFNVFMLCRKAIIIALYHCTVGCVKFIRRTRCFSDDPIDRAVQRYFHDGYSIVEVQSLLKTKDGIFKRFVG